MGNHEFCTECGASDFHYGRPCDPKRKKEHQEKQRRAKENYETLRQSALAKLETAGLTDAEKRVLHIR